MSAVFGTAPSEPYFTRQADGTIVATWPDPLAPTYPVSVEMLREWVDTFNDLAAAKRLLRDLVEEDDCSFDHHGGCQAHGYLSLDPGEMCPVEEAKRLIAKWVAS